MNDQNNKGGLAAAPGNANDSQAEYTAYSDGSQYIYPATLVGEMAALLHEHCTADGNVHPAAVLLAGQPDGVEFLATVFCYESLDLREDFVSAQSLSNGAVGIAVGQHLAQVTPDEAYLLGRHLMQVARAQA
jgi:hypothetical protein